MEVENSIANATTLSESTTDPLQEENSADTEIGPVAWGALLAPHLLKAGQVQEVLQWMRVWKATEAVDQERAKERNSWRLLWESTIVSQQFWLFSANNTCVH